jgi:hypothetical protein
VKGFIHIGGNPYQMLEVTEAEMDKLMESGSRYDWPYRFDKRKRVWPRPPADTEVFFYD